jgi:MFS family permease
LASEREITPTSLAVAGSTLVGTMCNGMMFASAAVSVFISQIATDYKWDHARIGGAVTCLFVGMAIGAPIFGRLIDRQGPRAILLPLTALSGLILASFSFMGRSLPLFYAAHLLLGAAQPGAVAYSKLLSTWFFRHRGVALTTLGVGTFVAQVAVPPIARSLQIALGWHGAYRVLALAELLIALPVLFAFFRERTSKASGAAAAESHEIHPDGAPAISVRKAISGGTFWLLVGAQVAGLFAFVGASTHAVGIMGEHGVTPAIAVWGLSIFAAGGLIAQLLTGYLLDRFDTPLVILPFAVGSLASILLLQFAHAQVMTLTAFLLFGVGAGGQTSITSYFTTRYFGVRNFSSIYGALFPMLILLGAPAPIIIGEIFDSSRSYDQALIALEVLLTGAIVCFWRLKPYSYPVKKG